MIKPLPSQYRVFCDFDLALKCLRLSHELFIGPNAVAEAERFIARGTGGWAVIVDPADATAKARHACPECAREISGIAQPVEASGLGQIVVNK